MLLLKQISFGALCRPDSKFNLAKENLILMSQDFTSENKIVSFAIVT